MAAYRTAPTPARANRSGDDTFTTPMDPEQIKRRIVELQIEHRDLDDAIGRLSRQSGVDELQLRRLKKRKLQIKDSMGLLQMHLIPDIPA